MSERLKISLSKLKVAQNIFVCSLLVLLLMVPFSTAISTKDGDYQALENDSYTIGVQAYIYGLAPVMMQRTENLFATTPGTGHAPVNQTATLHTLLKQTTQISLNLTQIRFTTLHGSNWGKSL